jgi:hypothetical protein
MISQKEDPCGRKTFHSGAKIPDEEQRTAMREAMTRRDGDLSSRSSIFEDRRFGYP